MTLPKHCLHIFFFLKSENLKAFTIYTECITWYIQRMMFMVHLTQTRRQLKQAIHISAVCLFTVCHYSREQFLDTVSKGFIEELLLQFCPTGNNYTLFDK